MSDLTTDKKQKLAKTIGILMIIQGVIMLLTEYLFPSYCIFEAINLIFKVDHYFGNSVTPRCVASIMLDSCSMISLTIAIILTIVTGIMAIKNKKPFLVKILCIAIIVCRYLPLFVMFVASFHLFADHIPGVKDWITKLFMNTLPKLFLLVWIPVLPALCFIFTKKNPQQK